MRQTFRNVLVSLPPLLSTEAARTMECGEAKFCLSHAAEFGDNMNGLGNVEPVTVDLSLLIPDQHSEGGSVGHTSARHRQRSSRRQPGHQRRQPLQRRKHTSRFSGHVNSFAKLQRGTGDSNVDMPLGPAAGDDPSGPAGRILGRRRPRILDGFMLLRAARAELPSQVRRVVISGRGLVDAQSEDLRYFSELEEVDASDNALPISKFAPLRALRVLRLHCNSLVGVKLPTGTFGALTTLDLSFNALRERCIRSLARLPALRELDLSSNDLQGLPSPEEMQRTACFPRLEVLVLERNRLARDSVFSTVSLFPNLKELNLSRNYLSGVPEGAASAGRFGSLEWLSLAHNLIQTREAVGRLLSLPRLHELVLIGNPVVRSHPDLADSSSRPHDRRKERAAGVDSVSDLVPTPPTTARPAARLRPWPVHIRTRAEDETESGLPMQSSRKKKKKKATSTYDAVALRRVMEDKLPRNAEWREAGNQFLFDTQLHAHGKEKAALLFPKRGGTLAAARTETNKDGENDDGAAAETESDEEEQEEMRRALEAFTEGVSPSNAEGFGRNDRATRAWLQVGEESRHSVPTSPVRVNDGGDDVFGNAASPPGPGPATRSHVPPSLLHPRSPLPSSSSVASTGAKQPYMRNALMGLRRVLRQPMTDPRLEKAALRREKPSFLRETAASRAHHARGQRSGRTPFEAAGRHSLLGSAKETSMPVEHVHGHVRDVQQEWGRVAEGARAARGADADALDDLEQRVERMTQG